MRYWLNVYRSGFVYIDLRFYTAWANSGHLLAVLENYGGVLSRLSNVKSFSLYNVFWHTDAVVIRG
jgi:hypothetical protein